MYTELKYYHGFAANDLKKKPVHITSKSVKLFFASVSMIIKYRCVMRPDKLFSKKQNWSFKDILSLTMILFNRNIYGIHVNKNYISYSVNIINFQNITYKK